MCADCRHKVALLLRAMLLTPCTVPEFDADWNEAARNTLDEVVAVLDVFLPSMPVDSPEVDAERLATVFANLSVLGTSGVIRTCGYLAQTLDKINAAGIVAMQARAAAGNPAAVGWFLMHGTELAAVRNPEMDDETDENDPIDEGLAAVINALADATRPSSPREN